MGRVFINTDPHMKESAMGKRRGGIVGYVALTLTGLAFFVLGLAASHLYLFSTLPASSGRQMTIVEIPQGLSGRDISRLLREKGVVEDDRLFYLLCRVRKAGRHLQAGEYGFAPLVTPNGIIDQMAAGRVHVRKVTFPEGVTLRDVAGTLQEEGLVSLEEFLRLASDPEVARSLGVPAPGLEGYLFPETYFFTRKMNELAIMKAMVAEFRTRLPPHWEARARELGFSLHELVILASLVEKEAAVDSERPLIAAVFHNRLRRGMPLQSDPTAVYDLEGFSGPVRAEHLKRESPYNTYRVKGLPVGPICNPGEKAIAAVLHPKDVNYLYFVSNNDGTHHFSSTLEEHSRAVGRYRVLRAQERAQEADPGGQGEQVGRVRQAGEGN